jgi:uncharacterized protein (DUF58 family)
VIQEIHYKIRWRARGHHPGHHRSAQSGGGLEFLRHLPLVVARDPRRIDLRASLRDPAEQFLVRTFRQRSQVPVYIVADLSASMGFAGERRKLDVLADLTESLAYSAARTGDRFGFVGCDEILRDDFALPASHAVGGGLAISARLRSFAPRATSARALELAVNYLPRQRALVFLVSDFHLPQALLARALDSLSLHEIVPVVLWDRLEYKQLPRLGFVRVRDAETGRERTLFMRAALRERIVANFEQHRRGIEQTLFEHQLTPLFLEDGFDAQRVTRHFFRDSAGGDALEAA